jgi:hypothetical protein
VAEYRYPAYKALCALIEKQMMSGNNSMVCACMQLLGSSTAAHPGNAHELLLNNGLPLIVQVLERSVTALQDSMSSQRDSLHVQICVFACQAAAAVAGEEMGRQQIATLESCDDNRTSLVRAVVGAMRLEQSGALTRTGLYFCMAASRHALLVRKLVEAGMLWSILNTMLRFQCGAPLPAPGGMAAVSSTHAEACGSTQEQPCGRTSTSTNPQPLPHRSHHRSHHTPTYLSVPVVLDDANDGSSANWHSVLSLWALGCLCRLDEGDQCVSRLHQRTASCRDHAPAVQAARVGEVVGEVREEIGECLQGLVTPWLARELNMLHANVSQTCAHEQVVDQEGVARVAIAKATGLLEVVSTRSSTAVCLWTPHMREQLLDFVAQQDGKGIEDAQLFVLKELQDEVCV